MRPGNLRGFGSGFVAPPPPPPPLQPITPEEEQLILSQILPPPPQTGFFERNFTVIVFGGSAFVLGLFGLILLTQT